MASLDSRLTDVQPNCIRRRLPRTSEGNSLSLRCLPDTLRTDDLRPSSSRCSACPMTCCPAGSSSFTHAQITDQLAYRRNAGQVTLILDGDHRPDLCLANSKMLKEISDSHAPACAPARSRRLCTMMRRVAPGRRPGAGARATGVEALASRNVIRGMTIWPTNSDGSQDRDVAASSGTSLRGTLP